MIRYKRITIYQGAAVFVLVAIAGFAFNRHLIDFAATTPPSPTPNAQLQQYINQGYRPAGCNVIKTGEHHCNIVIPVDKKGQAMRAHTFSAATKLRHDTASHTPHTTTSAPTDVYTPAQFHTAYQLPCTPGGPVQGACAQPSTFGPESIAIVDPGSYQGAGGIESNLAIYDQQFNLPTCTQANGCLKIVNQNGQTSPLPAPLPSGDNWDPEFDIDVQTVHMICQTCKIILVESTDDGESMNTAVPTAASFKPTAISLSWGGANEPADNADFQFKGIGVVGSTGDSGSDEAQGYPGDLADVINAAGTTLNLNADNTWKSETVWADSGGGCALSGFTAPAWQTSLPNWSTAGCNKTKGDGDLSADADPVPGVAEYSDGQWTYGGGTSLSTPIIAGALALGGGIPATEFGSQFIYQNATSADLHDIAQGSNCTATIGTHCTAGVGFDEPSGLGSFNGITLFGGTLAPANAGDINGDGKANITDLSILLAHWSITGATHANGDLNGDGTVNITDLSILLAHWTG